MAHVLRTGELLARTVAALQLGTAPVALYALAQLMGGSKPLEWVADSVSPMSSTMGRSNSFFR